MGCLAHSESSLNDGCYHYYRNYCYLPASIFIVLVLGELADNLLGRQKLHGNPRGVYIALLLLDVWA